MSVGPKYTVEGAAEEWAHQHEVQNATWAQNDDGSYKTPVAERAEWKRINAQGISQELSATRQAKKGKASKAGPSDQEYIRNQPMLEARILELEMEVELDSKTIELNRLRGLLKKAIRFAELSRREAGPSSRPYVGQSFPRRRSGKAYGDKRRRVDDDYEDEEEEVDEGLLGDDEDDDEEYNKSKKQSSTRDYSTSKSRSPSGDATYSTNEEEDDDGEANP